MKDGSVFDNVNVIRFLMKSALPIYVVSKHYRGEQRRKHKKKRINKKWLKRYGVWDSDFSNGCVFVDGKIYMSAPEYHKLKSAIGGMKNEKW